VNWLRKIADRLMPLRANRREFQRQVEAIRADGHDLDPETAQLWAAWGYRVPRQKNRDISVAPGGGGDPR
jgi:hypothetical protein